MVCLTFCDPYPCLFSLCSFLSLKSHLSLVFLLSPLTWPWQTNIHPSIDRMSVWSIVHPSRPPSWDDERTLGNPDSIKSAADKAEEQQTRFCAQTRKSRLVAAASLRLLFLFPVPKINWGDRGPCSQIPRVQLSLSFRFLCIWVFFQSYLWLLYPRSQCSLNYWKLLNLT